MGRPLWEARVLLGAALLATLLILALGDPKRERVRQGSRYPSSPKTWKHQVGLPMPSFQARPERQQTGTAPWVPNTAEFTGPLIPELPSLKKLAGSHAQDYSLQANTEMKNHQADMELDLSAVPQTNWPSSREDKEPGTPLRDRATDAVDDISSNRQEDLKGFEEEDSRELVNFSGWTSEENEDDEETWSPWSPCSATCGNATRQRIRYCGFNCLNTETRSCDDLPPCPGSVNHGEKWTPLVNNATNTNMVEPEEDACQKWLECHSEFLLKYALLLLQDLPGCPCHFPLEALRGAVSLQDEPLPRNFTWRQPDTPPPPPARRCLLSDPSPQPLTVGAQLCCYDRHLRLLTRGSGAGNPQLIRAAVSPELHFRLDQMPFLMCKGDWSRLHTVRPPDNRRGCKVNPGRREYLAQLREAQEY